MKKPIHCGRLVVNKDGQVKKLYLANGGGTRQCNWEHIDMDFDEIHEALRKLFGLGKHTFVVRDKREIGHLSPSRFEDGQICSL